MQRHKIICVCHDVYALYQHVIINLPHNYEDNNHENIVSLRRVLMPVTPISAALQSFACVSY